MTKKRKDGELNITQLAFRYNLSPPTVKQRLTQAGIPFREVGREKLFLLEDAEPFLESDEDINELKKRKLKAEAQEKEMKVAEKRGDLIPAVEVKEVVQKIFGTMHRDVTIKVPKKVAAKLKRLKTVREIQALLKQEYQMVFENLKNNYEDFL